MCSPVRVQRLELPRIPLDLALSKSHAMQFFKMFASMKEFGFPLTPGALQKTKLETLNLWQAKRRNFYLVEKITAYKIYLLIRYTYSIISDNDRILTQRSVTIF